jgi:hypothetical protein
VESLGIAIHSIPYSVYAAQNRYSVGFLLWILNIIIICVISVEFYVCLPFSICLWAYN